MAGGQPQEWLDERFIHPPAYPATVAERMDHDEGVDGAETKLRWVERTYRAMARIESEPATHRIVVTHGGTASWVIAAWMRLPVDACAWAAFRVASGSITTLYDDPLFHNRSLATLGCVAHKR